MWKFELDHTPGKGKALEKSVKDKFDSHCGRLQRRIASPLFPCNVRGITIRLREQFFCCGCPCKRLWLSETGIDPYLHMTGTCAVSITGLFDCCLCAVYDVFEDKNKMWLFPWKIPTVRGRYWPTLIASIIAAGGPWCWWPSGPRECYGVQTRHCWYLWPLVLWVFDQTRQNTLGFQETNHPYLKSSVVSSTSS